MKQINLIVFGEPASKANSRRLIPYRGRHISIKSEKALCYVRDFLRQVKWPKTPITEDITMTCHIFYGSRRPDLAEELIMDCLQKAGIIKNDRQIKSKHIHWHLDRENPRAVIRLIAWEEILPDWCCMAPVAGGVG